MISLVLEFIKLTMTQAFKMENELIGHFKIWGTVFLAEITAWNLSDFSELASIIAYLCGAIGSLALAYHHIIKKK